MTEFRYKAFISYSHSDEAWATWLHKALESYHLPRKLVNTKGRFGRVPSKLFPVFRDRDEFSSAADLSERVQDALNDSAALVVICSPAAAASRWVNEEIRTFRALGRGDRIHCMIVDGDPSSTDPANSCFPPALMEGVSENHEPLAADARQWADGKLLAKLKLVSGMLGIRLDELRQREQKRRRIQTAGYAVALVLALVLVALAAVSRIERQAQQQNAEALVSQVVEISRSLDSKVDLETQRALAERLKGYLENVNPADLTPESRKQVALVLRQLGSVNKAQGRLDEAMEAFSQSRAIFSDLSEEFPENLDYLYELGNAEFFVGDVHLERFQYEDAQTALLNYRDTAMRLVAAEPDNAAWVMEMSYANTNLAALAERSGDQDGRVALGLVEQAVQHLARAMELEPGNRQNQSQYSRTLAWLSDAQLRVCDLDGAWRSRVAGVALARAMSEEAPANRAYTRELAYALTGAAMVLRQRGDPESALEQLEEARNLLESLVSLDPSNVKLKWEATRRAALIASLQADLGLLSSALPAMAAVEPAYEEILASNEDEYLRRTVQFGQFLLDYADAAGRAGDLSLARRKLDHAVRVLDEALSVSPDDRASRDAMRMAEFRWWELHGEVPSEIIGKYSLREGEPDFDSQGCAEANLSAHRAILRGNRALAEEHTNYLLEKGYQDPGFMQFCRRYTLCDI